MNEERIKELRALCDNATPGNWNIEKDGTGYDVYTNHIYHGVFLIAGFYALQGYSEHDAKLFVASRTAIPELLDEIERLKTIIEKVNSYDPYIIPDIQSGAITIHD